MATIKDIAQKAGVSVSTVSYVISGARPISDKVKIKVRAAMKELGYMPNPMARGLAGKKTRILALIMNPPERGMGMTEMELITKAAEAAREMNYHLVLLSENFEDISQLEEIIDQRLFDGFILFEIYENDKRVELFQHKSIPYILIGQCEKAQPKNVVDIDFEKMSIDCLEYLAKGKFHNILFINQSQAVADIGYGPSVKVPYYLKKYAQPKGMSFSERHAHSNKNDGYQVFKEAYQLNPQIDIVLIMNDKAIPGVIKAMNELSLHIPHDISLITLLSSQQVTELFNPSLTCMEIPSRALGYIGIKHLIQMIEGKEIIDKPILVPSSIKLQESTPVIN
ncbi:LacI family DNA-binding transcriptional regulator [Spirochaeta cellobiosiphila]|uniref:LacI family DNA-binding transcriptional regulator n=1 Tax=Spirochaeta cellobiosiphila TaxID=504483 RepID=UPI0004166A27|nr:LacI family DNA-binding transcriptional regulator [Spirochaeta cellobiosiphila]